MIGLALVPIAYTIRSASKSNSLPGDRHRAAPAGIVGLAEFHAHAAHAAHAALAVVEDRDRVGQPVELDAFLLGVMHFLGARRRLGARAAVDAVHLLGAQPQRDAHRVHRGVAGADHGDALADRQRRVEVREVAGAHQVAARQQFVGRQHAVRANRRECPAWSDSRRRRRRTRRRKPISSIICSMVNRRPTSVLHSNLTPSLRQVVDLGVDHRRWAGGNRGCRTCSTPPGWWKAS